MRCALCAAQAKRQRSRDEAVKAMENDGKLRFPMVAVNNAKCKYLFDNRYGTGQSVWNGINRTTKDVYKRQGIFDV